MKRYLVLALIALLFAPELPAQNHGEVGVFVNYFRFEPLDLNMVGLGGRVSFNVHENVQFEAEMAYDFARGFTETCSACIPVETAPSDFRVLHGLFGPKFQTGGGAIRAFFTVKGGFINFRVSDKPVTFGNVFSDIESLRVNDVNGVLYPGGGLEFFAGPFGLRFDIGDEIYFLDGAQHNLRITAGPHIRF